MPLPRFFVDMPLAVAASVPLAADVAHHAARVLRLRNGAPIVVFNGHGGEYRACLRLKGAAALADIEAFDPIERESPLKLTLLQALVAAEKLDWIVEKAIELGVESILVVPMQRSVVRLDAARAARRVRHWSDIARAACCQCGRNRVPAVEFCSSFDAGLAAVAADQQRLMLLPTAEHRLPSPLAGTRAALMIGPEGGFAEDEVLRARQAGFITVQLGPRILRTETAGLAALAALQAAGGDLA
jgi:16S rRNA (uracil1498-N3)-methyltransferase